MSARPSPAGVTGVVHVHSDYSHDGRDSLERLRKFAVEHGLRFIALTDHAEDLTADRWNEYVEHCAAASDDSVALIPGLEFRFAGHTGLHLLALGLASWIAPSTPGEFIARTAGRCALTIVAHPILARYRVPDDVREAIDAIEVWNAVYNTRYLPDPRAIRLLHEIRRTRPTVTGIAGLDQHDAANYRETRVVLSDASPEILAPLRGGRYVNVGRTMRFGAHVEIDGARLGALRAVRWAFDRVERAQDSMVRALRSSR